MGVSFDDHPSEGENLSGTITVNASTVTDKHVRNVTFSHNESDVWTSIETVANDTDEDSYFETSFNTSEVSDGTFFLKSTARNTSHINRTVRKITVDNTLPNATDDLNVDNSYLTDSPFVPNLINSTVIQLNWSEFSQSTEISDATTGVKEAEIMVRGRSYNHSTQNLSDEWSEWNEEDTVDSPAKDTSTTVTLEDGYQYEAKLVVVDNEDHRNESNIVNFTIDASPPRFDISETGKVVEPLEWTSQNRLNLTANLTDVRGIHTSRGDTSDPQAINISVSSTSSDWKMYPNFTVSPDTSEQMEIELKTTDTVGTLNHSTDYEVSITSTDYFEMSDTISWEFTPDLEAPDDVDVSASGDQSGDWYKDNVVFEVTCSDDVSGVDQVAVGSSDWKDEGSEFSFDDSGENSYTFKCRDNVGNVDDSLSKSYKVDTGTPSFDYADPGDNEENVPVSFEFFASFSDESDESGIDTGESSLSLEGGDGDIDDIEWDDDSVTAQVDDLEVDESYEVEGEIVDNVGHSDSFTVDFDTASLTSSDLQITSLSDTVTLYRNDSTDVSFDVENDGEIEQTGIELNFTVEEINSSLDQDSGFDLEADGSESITVDLSADAAIEPGVYEATVEVESDEGISNSATIDIRVVDEGVMLDLEDYPSEVDIEQGGLVSETFDISNIGEDTASDVSFSLPVENVSVDLDPETSSIDSLSTQEIIATFSVSNSTGIRVQDANFTAEGSSSSVEGAVSIKIQPASNQTKQDIETDQQDISTRVDNMVEEMNQTKTANIRALMSQAKASLDQEDYATAAEIHQQVEEELDEERELLSGLPLLPMVIVAVILLLGFIGYLLIPEPESSEGGQSSGESKKSSSSSSILGPVRPSKDEGYSYEDKSLAGKITGKIGGIGGSIAGVFSSSGAPDEKSSLDVDDVKPASTSDTGSESSEKDEDFEYHFKERN
ncbi:MAG: hypothetical protein MUP63_02495 [Candidatus Nanohaloarchaeota archaeon QJJ-7]|nr:hypothetical protein [Candidatus Nanohaloarchaeota archaeon QJJ-7]